jgi:predicted permease
MFQDMKYAVRMLRRSPGFAIVAILSLALGIGANSAIFTVTNAVLLISIPVSDVERLVQIQTADRENPSNLTAISLPNFRDLREQNHVFSDLFAATNATVTLSGRGEAQPLPVQLVSANYFDALGVKSARGRTFFPDEDRTEGGNPVAVLSHAVWVDRFGGAPGIVGQSINLNETPFTVIGVAPPSFKGVAMMADPEIVWIPMSMHSQAVSGTVETNFENRRLRMFSIYGRLQPATSIEAADAEMKVIATRLEREFPFANDGHTLAVTPLTANALSGVGGRTRLVAAAFALSGAAGLVLLIACLNLANMLMARATWREREMGIRAALGAERGRLSRQLLTENLLIAAAGGLGGFLLAFWGRETLWAFRPPFLPANAIELRFDPRVVLFTVAATLLTGFVFGLAPAFRGSRPDVNGILKCGGRGSSGAAGTMLRRALVISQIALTVIALAGAGLFIHSMENAQHIDPGFESRKLFSFGIDLASLHWSAERGIAFQHAVLDRVRGVPGVEAAALASSAPFTVGLGRTILKQGQENEPHPRGTGMAINHVSPGYFDTLRIRVLEGRVINELDRGDTAKVVVINQAVANVFWPGQSAVGKKLYYLSDPVIREVIGVVGTTIAVNFGEVPRPMLYIPLTQNYQPFAAIDVRTKGDPAPVLAAALTEVQRMNGALALVSPRTVQQQIGQGLWAPRMGAALFGLFGIIGLLLASVGIYGVMSYMVAQRTSEIGIRMALGAQPREVVAMVVGESFRLAAIGLAAGFTAAFALAKFVRGLFFELSPADPMTFATVALVLILVTTIAGWIPGRRASRIDPIVALRNSG